MKAWSHCSDNENDNDLHWLTERARVLRGVINSTIDTEVKFCSISMNSTNIMRSLCVVIVIVLAIEQCRVVADDLFVFKTCKANRCLHCFFFFSKGIQT